MTLDWIPVGRTFETVDESGPQEYQVHGIAAYGIEGQCYEIWPVDPKGTPDDAWKLTLYTGEDYEDLGVFADLEEAKLRAQQHRDGLQEAECEGEDDC